MAGDAPNFGKISANPEWKIAIVTSVWHPECTSALRDGAVKELVALGIPRDNIALLDAPGSFEIPLLCKKSLENGADAAIAFGVIVQGATHHARLVAEESARGCMNVQLELGKPIIYEVLFVENIEDAQKRSIGAGGKGGLAAQTVLTQLAKMAELS
jgi:6,7-dimethyl-8-ribityllumazine synthase